jgi:hypothetical protein
VTIFNASSLYNYTTGTVTAGGTYGGITLSGGGTFALTAPTSGPYAGILIYQSRDNTRALSLSGGAMANMAGVVYAKNALLSLSGSATLTNVSIDVNLLTLSGSATLTQLVQGSDGPGDSVGIADSLLAGDLYVYVNDPLGYFTADMLARIQDAITGIDNLLVPYNVSITEVSDPSLANVSLDANTTSASGDMAAGVLGCYNPTGSQVEITLIEGWNWYGGADPGGIGAGQYDFQTTVTHEFGHALGLGGSPSDTSPMNETLPAGTARRVMTAADLNIPEPLDGVDPLRAAVPAPDVASGVNTPGNQLQQAGDHHSFPSGNISADATPRVDGLLATLTGSTTSLSRTANPVLTVTVALALPAQATPPLVPTSSPGRGADPLQLPGSGREGRETLGEDPQSTAPANTPPRGQGPAGSPRLESGTDAVLRTTEPSLPSEVGNANPDGFGTEWWRQACDVWFVNEARATLSEETGSVAFIAVAAAVAGLLGDQPRNRRRLDRELVHRHRSR